MTGGFVLERPLAPRASASFAASFGEVSVTPMTNESGKVKSQEEQDHATKRVTRSGRWWPVGLYGANLVLSMITVLVAEAWDLLWLALLPVPALGLYLYRTKGSGE